MEDCEAAPALRDSILAAVMEDVENVRRGCTFGRETACIEVVVATALQVNYSTLYDTATADLVRVYRELLRLEKEGLLCGIRRILESWIGYSDILIEGSYWLVGRKQVATLVLDKEEVDATKEG